MTHIPLDRKKLGDKVKSLRLSRRLTQEELASKIKLSICFISLIENGHKDPSLKTLDSIAKALSVRAVHLLQT